MKSFSLPALFAGLTLIIAICTILYKMDIKPHNPLPDGKQPILLFEFAQTDQDIQQLFVTQTKEPAKTYIDKMRELTYIDFLFILGYTLFTSTFIWQAGNTAPSVWLRLALITAPLIGLFDVLENIQLLRILALVNHHTTATVQPILPWLSLFTWLKWEATALLMGLVVPFLWQGGYLSKLLAGLAVAVCLAGVLALIEHLATTTQTAAAFHFAGLVLRMFVLLAIYTIIRNRVKRPVAWL